MVDESTITAFATPPIESAIIVLRVSGTLSSEIIGNVFKLKNHPIPRYSKYGFYRDISGAIVDDCLYVFFDGKSSYTGEDSFEIYCHGNPLLARKIFSDLIARGCREAMPGEFTRRAFLNGKIDLVQAEAVADVISARSEISLKASRKLISGTFGKMILKWSSDITDLIAELELQIDFSDEEIPSFNSDLFKEKLIRIKRELGEVENSSRYSALVHDRVNAVIFGAPNAGKSSLFNILLGDDRALVSDEAGTTRDFISENISVGEYSIRILDTAGIRENVESKIEKAGIVRSIECMKKADFLIFVIDSSDIIFKIPERVAGIIRPENTLIVFNKIDLNPEFNKPEIFEEFNSVNVSLLNANSRRFVCDAIIKLMVERNVIPDGDVMVVNARHAEFLRRAKTCIHEAIISFGSISIEFTINNLRSAIDELSEILGRFDNEKVLDQIFSSFCIGK